MDVTADNLPFFESAWEEVQLGDVVKVIASVSRTDRVMRGARLAAQRDDGSLVVPCSVRTALELLMGVEGLDFPGPLDQMPVDLEQFSQT